MKFLVTPFLIASLVLIVACGEKASTPEKKGETPAKGSVVPEKAPEKVPEKAPPAMADATGPTETVQLDVTGMS